MGQDPGAPGLAALAANAKNANESKARTLKGTKKLEARKRCSPFHTKTYADATRQGAAPHRPAPPARPAHSESLAVASPAPEVEAVKPAPPTKTQRPATPGTSGLKTTPRQARSDKQTRSPQARASSASQEAMDTTPAPLPTDEGRTLLNAVVNILSTCGYKTEMDTVGVACDGTDPQYTAFLGYHRGGGTCSRVIVSCRGPIESKKDLPTFGCIQRKHFWGLSQSHTHTTMQVNSKYDILRHYDPSQQSSREDIMVLECSWNKAAVLQQPPCADALCHLNVQTLPGNERSAARSVYKEMKFAKQLVECLTTGAVAWAPDLSGPTLIEKVTTLLQGSRKGSYRGKSGTPFADVGWNSVDFDLYVETVVMSKRQSVDFTDEMWNAMSGCGTYQELKEGFCMIFHAVQAGEIRPLIVPKNATTVGAYLRNMSPQFRQEGTMGGLMPVPMLAEIGLQKLQRDFVNIFVGLELASQEQLVPFLVCPTKMDEALGELWKLQTVLDMIMLCKAYPAPPPLIKEVSSGSQRPPVLRCTKHSPRARASAARFMLPMLLTARTFVIFLTIYICLCVCVCVLQCKNICEQNIASNN
ncbi:protein zwilch homolog [Dermacentor albipictus]|uniref:protein zwilch homolog n=1 Tax=Dermacentor albipictus TaxID=60249 RepID=UPI0038FC68F7